MNVFTNRANDATTTATDTTKGANDKNALANESIAATAIAIPNIASGPALPIAPPIAITRSDTAPIIAIIIPITVAAFVNLSSGIKLSVNSEAVTTEITPINPIIVANIAAPVATIDHGLLCAKPVINANIPPISASSNAITANAVQTLAASPGPILLAIIAIAAAINTTVAPIAAIAMPIADTSVASTLILLNPNIKAATIKEISKIISSSISTALSVLVGSHNCVIMNNAADISINMRPKALIIFEIDPIGDAVPIVLLIAPNVRPFILTLANLNAERLVIAIAAIAIKPIVIVIRVKISNPDCSLSSGIKAIINKAAAISSIANPKALNISETAVKALVQVSFCS